MAEKGPNLFRAFCAIPILLNFLFFKEEHINIFAMIFIILYKRHSKQFLKKGIK